MINEHATCIRSSVAGSGPKLLGRMVHGPDILANEEETKSYFAYGSDIRGMR